MGNIGDFLENKQKEKLIESSIEIGDVYRMKLTKEEGVTPKNVDADSRNKYFIVLGIEKGIAIGLVLINSHINASLQQCLKDLHYPLKVADYSFLEKDRFACCGELKSISISKFITLFGSPKGSLKNCDLELIREAVINSPKAIPKDLKRFGLIEK